MHRFRFVKGNCCFKEAVKRRDLLK